MCAVDKNPALQIIDDSHIGLWTRNMVHAAVAPINAAYAAVKKYTAVRLASMAGLAASIESYYTGHSGVLGDDMVYTPLTMFGSGGERFRLPVMCPLHEAVLTNMMSEPRMEDLKETLREHDLGIMSLCCCGTLLGPYDKVQEFYRSDEHLERDQVRSFFDAQATSITMVDSIDEMREQGIISPDFSSGASRAEDRLFARIETLIDMVTHISPALEQDEMSMRTRIAAIAQRAQYDAPASAAFASADVAVASA